MGDCRKRLTGTNRVGHAIDLMTKISLCCGQFLMSVQKFSWFSSLQVLPDQLSPDSPATLFPNPHNPATLLAGAHMLIIVACLTISSSSETNQVHCSKFCPQGEYPSDIAPKRCPRLGHPAVAVLCQWCLHIVQNRLSKPKSSFALSTDCRGLPMWSQNMAWREKVVSLS